MLSVLSVEKSKEPPRLLVGSLTFTPVNQHHRKIGITAAHIHGANAATGSSLINVDARDLAQEFRDTGGLLGSNLLMGNDRHWGCGPAKGCWGHGRRDDHGLQFYCLL